MSGVSIGAAGEVAAARFLRDKGYTILAANYRCRFGEIDIIARDGPYIAFVEVKTRSSRTMYAPREAVTVQKQRRILTTAGDFMEAQYDTLLDIYGTDPQPRFDVIEIITKPGHPLEVLELDHLISAYEAGDLSRSY